MTRRLFISICIAQAAGLILAGPVAVRAAEDAVESGRSALNRWDAYPWYDASQDDVRRIDVAPPPAAPRPRDYKPWNFSLPGLGQLLALLLQVLGWTVLIAALALVAWLMIRAYLRRETETGSAAGRLSLDLEDGDVDRIEALPFKVKRPLGDLLAEARRLYQEGNYDEAIVYYYSYLLVEMDKAHFLRLARGKTNRQYLREIRHHPGLVELVSQSMVAFEDVFFGRHTIRRQRFEGCWNRLDEFHGMLEEVPA